MLKNITLLIFIIVLSGCGMMGNSSKKDTTLASIGIDRNDSSGNLMANSSLDSNLSTPQPSTITDAEEESSILPQTISMEFPNILKPDSDTNSSSENNQSEDSNISIISDISEDNETVDSNSSLEDNKTLIINEIGYEQLKKNISQIEDIVKIAQINLILLEEVMPQVLDRCEGMLSCTFEPQILSVVLDNKTISKIDDIVDDSNFTLDEYNNSRVSLGELEFIKNYVSEGTDYELKLDMASNDTILRSFYKESNESDNNITIKNKNDINRTLEEFQVFKWSDYSKDVTTRYFYRDINRSIDISIYYLTDESGKETMHVYNRLAEEGHKENMSLTLANREDDNSTIQIQTNSIEERSEGNDTNISSFSSTGEITDDNSLILFSGSLIDPTSENNITTSTEVICSNSNCNENNSSSEENSSIIDSNEDNITNEEENSSIINSNEEIANIRDNLQFYQLKITDINLTDGSFLLLPPYTDIEGFSLIDIFEVTLGTFTIFEGKAQGEIHNSSYNDMLDTLTIVKIREPDEVNSSRDIFEVINNRPKIEIID